MGEKRPLFKATCPCGHVGMSMMPSIYLCSACYYESQAGSELEKARKLEARAKRLRVDALNHRILADSIRQKRRSKK